MANPTMDTFIDDSSKNNSSIVFEKESSNHFLALKDYLTRSMRSETSTDIANIVPKEHIAFHYSNDRTAMTLEMSDIESSMGEAEDNDGELTTNDDSLPRSSALRLSMCGGIHETGEEETETSSKHLESSDTPNDWKSVASTKEEIASDDKVEEGAIVHRRASNPLMLGRRFSAQGSRRDSVMSASMQEAFQQVRNTFEHQEQAQVEPSLAGKQQQQLQPEEDVSEFDDDDFGYYDHYGYGDAVPDNKEQEVVETAPKNRKSSMGHRLESVHQGSMVEAFEQVHITFESAPPNVPQWQQQQDNTDYGYGDAVPDHSQQVDYGYEDATPQPNTAETTSPTNDNAPSCVFWDVQEEDDDVGKYGYGEDHLPSRRASGAHYDYGYGSDHDMDSTWHNGENMGNPSNRILPHQDPAVTTHHHQQQPSSRRMRRQRQQQQQDPLRRSWNAQEQPRRRVQRRSSVTKYNLEESMVKVQREEEQLAAAIAAEQNPTPTSHSIMLRDHKEKQKKKRKIRLVPFRFSSRGGRRPSNKTKNNKNKSSRKSMQRLREILPFGRRTDTNTTTGSTTIKCSGSSSVRPSFQQEQVPERSSRFRLWFRNHSKDGRGQECQV